MDKMPVATVERPDPKSSTMVDVFVTNAHGIKDALKANGYRYEGFHVSPGWAKMDAADGADRAALLAELDMLKGLGAKVILEGREYKAAPKQALCTVCGKPWTPGGHGHA